MAIIRKWIEVEDECLGPDKTNGHWEMFLFINKYVKYSRKTKRGLKKFTRKSKTIEHIEGKFKRIILSKLKEYLAQSNVFLLAD